MRASCVLLLILLLVYPPIALAQIPARGNKSTTTTQPRSASIPYSVEGIDLQLDSLPKGYRGHDPVLLLNKLIARNMRSEKGEFETTAQVEQRVRFEEAKPLLGKLTVDDLFAVMLPVESVYDADRQEMEVAIILNGGRVGMVGADFNNWKVELRTKRGKPSFYKANNVFGAPVTVRKEDVTNYLIVFNRADLDAEKFNYQDALLSRLSMNVERAKSTKSFLRALAIVRLIKPFAKEATGYKSPKLSDPVEEWSHYNFLVTELVELWLYDMNTGQIFLKRKNFKAATSGLLK